MIRMSTQNKKREEAIENDPRWAAIAARDVEHDGKFYYSVKSTGIYCRPSCASRLAKPENVQFYATCQDAEAAGFRPCKRCIPHQPKLFEQYAKKIIGICRLIEAAEKTPNLNALASYIRLSPYHFHRIFKAIIGVTPRVYAAAHRAKCIRNELEQSQTVTEAIFDAGYSSSGRFYETADKLLGMTPSNYRAGGINTEIYFAVGECSLGSILVAMSARGVCAILLGDDPNVLAYDLQDKFPNAILVGGDAHFEQLVAKVVGFVETPTSKLDLPLDIRGTAFQQRVWQALTEIPLGSTASYTDIANRINCPKAVRAVAQACGANTLAVAIPCHRVIRRNGGMAGYRWGVERKRALLKKEAERM